MRQNLAGTVADDKAAGGACQGGDCGGGGVGGRGGGGGHPVQEELALTVPGLLILLLCALHVTDAGERDFFLVKRGFEIKVCRPYHFVHFELTSPPPPPESW